VTRGHWLNPTPTNSGARRRRYRHRGDGLPVDDTHNDDRDPDQHRPEARM